MIENSILRNGILLWKVRLFPVKSPFHQPLINTSILTYTILPRNGENVLYYLNIFNSKLSLPLFWTKGELREPILEMNFGGLRKPVLSEPDRTLLPQNQWQPTGNPLTMDGLTTAHIAASEKSEWWLLSRQ